MICIDINDCGLTATDESGRQLGERDPGFASQTFEGDWLFGQEARGNARLSPNETAGGFWDRLHLPDDPISERIKGLSNRDAALEHLSAFCRKRQIRGDAVFVIPTSFSSAARSILLKIGKDAGLKNCACVDAGLASFLINRTRLRADTNKVFYLDITRSALYGGVVTVSDEIASSESMASDDACGFAMLEEEVFLKSDKVCLEQMKIRPSKKGATEQALFDQIPMALDGLKSNALGRFDINGRQAEMTIEVYEEATKVFFDTLVGFIRNLLQGESGQQEPSMILVSHRLSELPGIEDQMKRLPDLQPVFADKDYCLSRGAFMWKSALGSGEPSEASTKEIRFGQQEAEEAEEQEAELTLSEPVPKSGDRSRLFSTGAEGFLKSTRSSPTHLLFQGWLLPLGKGSFKIGRVLEEGTNGLLIEHPIDDVSDQHCELHISGLGEITLTDWGEGRVYVNDEPAKSGQALKVGDYLGIGGHRVEMMCTSIIEDNQS